MAERYIPPALRKRANPFASQSPKQPPSLTSWADESSLFTSEEVHRYFWPLHQGEPGKSDAVSHDTLNASAERQNSLAYILLFYRANPQWSTDKIIYVKSNLDLILPLSAGNNDDKGGAKD